MWSSWVLLLCCRLLCLVACSLAAGLGCGARVRLPGALAMARLDVLVYVAAIRACRGGFRALSPLTWALGMISDMRLRRLVRDVASYCEAIGAWGRSL